MPKVDWSKPIEVYDPYNPNEPPDPAEVIEAGLRGDYPIGIKWRTPSEDLLMNVDESGCILEHVWQVRNAPTQVTKYILVLKDQKGENRNDNKVVVLYSTYEKAEADCTGAHKIVEVTYEL